MSKSLKLVLDLLIGAVVPVLILKFGSAPLGTLPAYLLAALVPVAWVLLDLLVISRRFNFITSFGGLLAVMRGALAFWYVDGVRFALKDSATYAISALVFGISVFLARPVTRYIAMQGLAPETPAQERALDELLDEPSVIRALRQSALLVAAINVACGIANYVINVRMVVAPFNTPAFNDQVANVNAITRFALVIPDMLAIFFAFSLMYKALYALLPMPVVAKGDLEPSFWSLVELRDAARHAEATAAVPGDGDPVVATLAARQAREEFGLPR